MMSNSTYTGGPQQQSAMQGLSQLGAMGGGCITGTTTVAYPNMQNPFWNQHVQESPPMVPVMQMIPGTLGFYVSPVANGFLVGMNNQSLDKAKFCTNYTEAAEAIVALLALHKIMEQSNGK